MVQRGLEGCDILFDISRLGRKRAYSWNKESEAENSDIFRLKRQIRKTKNMDEDYVQYLMLLLDYDEESKCYTNEAGNEGPAVATDRLNHDMDEDVNEYEGDEGEDEDIDPDYKKFLANAKPNGNSYRVKIDRKVGFPVFVEFEKDDVSDGEFECTERRKHQDSGDEKDLGNISCKDTVESQPFSRIVEENDDKRSAGDNNVIFEPFDPVTPTEKGLTIQKPSLGENGECKRLPKGEMKNRSNYEQKKKGGRKSAKVTTKEEGADIDEDYSILLEKFICKNWSTTTSFMKKYNLKRKKSSTTVLENDSDISEGNFDMTHDSGISEGDFDMTHEPFDPLSEGDFDMTHEPSDPLSPKNKRKRGRPRKKNSTKGNDASKRQGKDSDISEGDFDMTHVPSDPLSPKNKKKRGRPSKKNSMKENDASKRQEKDSNLSVRDFEMTHEPSVPLSLKKKKKRGRPSKKNSMKGNDASKRQEKDSNLSVGDFDMTHEPSVPLSPKKKKKRGRPSKKNSMKGNDASKRQGKGEKRKRSNEMQTVQKGRKLAVDPLNEDVAGREDIAVKEERDDVDEASFKSGSSFECEAADEDLQIVVNGNRTIGKEGGSNLVEASLAKHCENVDDILPRKTVRTDFWWNAKALLERPYDQKEHISLWKAVKSRKPTLKGMDLRNGKFCSTRRLGKSYLDHYKDLHEKLKEVGNNVKQLNILRSFFFWLQNLTQTGAFKPWTNLEWLSLVDNSAVPMLASNK